jgi:hypothetical protein
MLPRKTDGDLRYLVNGTFPDRVRNTIPRSIMKDFSAAEAKLIAKSGDFFAIGMVYHAVDEAHLIT